MHLSIVIRPFSDSSISSCYNQTSFNTEIGRRRTCLENPNIIASQIVVIAIKVHVRHRNATTHQNVSDQRIRCPTGKLIGWRDHQLGLCFLQAHCEHHEGCQQTFHKCVFQLLIIDCFHNYAYYLAASKI